MNTLTITPYSGSTTDPRGRSPKYLRDPAAFYAEWTARILAIPTDRRPKRAIVQRAAGMDPMHLGKSWAIDDYRDLTHAERDILASFCLSMDREGIVCALCVGSRIDDAGVWRRVHAGCSQHRAAFARTIDNAKRLGFTEVWVDTGGDIYDIDDFVSDAADRGVTVVPECGPPWRIGGPAYIRCRRKQTDDENVSFIPHDGPLFVLFGWNSGGIEPKSERDALCPLAARQVGWNETARAIIMGTADADGKPTTAKEIGT